MSHDDLRRIDEATGCVVGALFFMACVALAACFFLCSINNYLEEILESVNALQETESK